MLVMIQNALENIRTNKLRVIVAMVWIVLGITSVVVVSSIGNGIEQTGNESSKNEDFRTSSFQFYPDYESNFDPTFYEAFTQEDVGSIAGMPGVEKVTPKYGETSGGNGASLDINGSNLYTKLSQYESDKKIDIAYGRNFSLDDLDRNTIVVDYSIAYKLGDSIPQNAVGKSLNIDGIQFEVVGVLKEVKSDDKFGNSYIESECFLSKKSLKEIEDKRSFGGPITTIEVLVKHGYDVGEVMFSVKEKVFENKPKENGEYGVGGTDSGEHELRVMQQTINRFTAIISNVALLIGGIGIMNIMYMSVAERKREIGIRRAIGAEPKDILIQFLIETIVITILGGIIGMIVGTIAASQVAPYLGMPAIPSAAVYIKAVVVSILTGAIFGAIPANKAAKMDPITAIQG